MIIVSIILVFFTFLVVFLFAFDDESDKETLTVDSIVAII
jgi:hypothetical protein